MRKVLIININKIFCMNQIQHNTTVVKSNLLSVLRNAVLTIAVFLGGVHLATAQCPIPTVSMGIIDNKAAEVTWLSLPGVAWFTIDYSSVSASGPWTSASAAGAATSKFLTGLTPSTTYYVRMNSNCTSPVSTSSYATTSFMTTATSSCGTPVVTAGSSTTTSSINVSWTAVPGATYYRERHRVSPAGPWSAIGSTASTSKTIVGLAPGTTYDVEIQTVCTSPIDGDWSTAVQATTCDAIVPSVSSASICYYKSADLNVTSLNDPNYTYLWKPGFLSGASQTVSPTTTTVYTVTATATGGCSASATISLTVNPSTLPTSTGSYTETINHADGETNYYVDGSCSLIARIDDDLDANTLGSTSVTSTVTSTVDLATLSGRMLGKRSIEVTPTTDGPGVVTLYFDQTDFDDYNTSNTGGYFLPLPTNPIDPSAIYFRIVKYVGGVPSGALKTLTWDAANSRWQVQLTETNVGGTYYFYTMPSCTGVTISGLTAGTVTGSSVQLSWTTYGTPVGFYSFRYENVTDNPGVWIDGGTANSSPVTKSGLLGGKNYNFQIRGNCSSQSEGAWSSSVNFTTNSTCGAPVLAPETGVTTSEATVNWGAVTGAAWYNVRYKESSNMTWGAPASTGGTSKKLTGLSASTSYDYQVLTKCSATDVSAWTSGTFVTPASRPGAIEENLGTFASGISVYPNPASDLLHIDLTAENTSSATIKLFDMSGRLIQQVVAQSQIGINSFEMDINKLANGIYTLQVFEDNKLSYTQRVTKRN